MSLLDRDPTPEDLEAEREAPRPGVWAGESGADLRKLTQDETDALIRAELWHMAMPLEDLTAAVGKPHGIQMQTPRENAPGGVWMSLARCQRGGIDSDPLVRILARRAWGDRDRQWFERTEEGRSSLARDHYGFESLTKIHSRIGRVDRWFAVRSGTEAVVEVTEEAMAIEGGRPNGRLALLDRVFGQLDALLEPAGAPDPRQTAYERFRERRMTGREDEWGGVTFSPPPSRRR